MGQQTKIEWCDHTVNLWWGCVAVHEGCDNCYAETLAKRWGNDIWGNEKPRKEIKSAWIELLKMQKRAKEEGKKRRVFVGSMMDIFEKPMPLIGAAIPEYTTGVLRARLFQQIDENCYPDLIFLFLTKRPSNINKYIPEKWLDEAPENVMFGTSPVNETTATKLVYQLLQVKGKRFLSVEPQLAEIDWYKVSGNWENDGHPWRNAPILTGIDWVIQGGESGHHKRPFNLDWAYKMKEQCEGSETPYFFKQINKIQEIPADLMARQFPLETVGSAFP